MEHEANAESCQVLRPVQLRIDALADVQNVDEAIRARRAGSRPGLRALLTERRNAMAAEAHLRRGEVC